MSDIEKFQDAIKPIVELVNQVRRENEGAAERLVQGVVRCIRAAVAAKQEDFQPTPPQPACPSVRPGDSSQVSGSCKSSTQEAE